MKETVGFFEQIIEKHYDKCQCELIHSTSCSPYSLPQLLSISAKTYRDTAFIVHSIFHRLTSFSAPLLAIPVTDLDTAIAARTKKTKESEKDVRAHTHS